MNKGYGFTLIELLIAIILIVGGLMVLMRMMSIGIYADSNLEYSLTALNLANEKLEEIKDLDYSYVSSASETGSSLGFDFVDERLVNVGFVDANLNSTTSDLGLKDVKVQVQWTQKGGQESVEAQTYITDLLRRSLVAPEVETPQIPAAAGKKK